MSKPRVPFPTHPLSAKKNRLLDGSVDANAHRVFSALIRQAHVGAARGPCGTKARTCQEEEERIRKAHDCAAVEKHHTNRKTF